MKLINSVHFYIKLHCDKVFRQLIGIYNIAYYPSLKNPDILFHMFHEFLERVLYRQYNLFFPNQLKVNHINN